MIKYWTGKTGEFEHETNAGNPQKPRERESNKPCGLISRICVSAIMLFVGTMVPFEVFSADLNNPEIQRLIAEKQQKIAALEECGKKVKGFKIAGISTIGLTTVGTIGNIALSNKREDVSNQLQTANQTLSAQQAEQRQAEIDAAKKAAVDDARAQEIASIKLNSDDIGNGFTSKSINGGDDENSNYKKCPEITKNGDWCVPFDEYVVNGTSTCVSDYNNEVRAQKATNQGLSAVQSSGKYCYCKMTSWTPNGGTQQSAASSWVFTFDFSSDASCADSCASGCAIDVKDDSVSRRAVFGSVAN